MAGGEEQMLVIIFFVCCIFSLLSVTVTSGDEEPKPKQDPAPDPSPVPAPAPAQEEASGLSYSTSAALSAETEFIVPQVKAGIIPVNCELSDWENVGDTCNSSGQQEQVKRVITEGRNGGQVCPVPDSDERIRTVDCDVDCVQTETWSGCDKSTGTRTVTRTTTQQQWNNGAACKPPTAKEPCVVDCQVSGEKYVNDNICTAYCGGGGTWSYKSIITTPKNGGQACPSRAERTIRRACPHQSTLNCYEYFTKNSNRVSAVDGTGITTLKDMGEVDCSYSKHGETRYGGIKGFKLERDGNKNEIYYKVTCAKWPNDGVQNTTKGAYAPGSDINHYGQNKDITNSEINVDCGDYPIAKFTYTYNQYNNIQGYSYTCSKTQKDTQSDRPKTESKETTADVHGNKVVYLDRHDLQCPDQFLLTQFKPTNVNGKIKYTYTCRRMPDKLRKGEDADVNYNDNKLRDIFNAEDLALGITTT